MLQLYRVTDIRVASLSKVRCRQQFCMRHDISYNQEILANPGYIGFVTNNWHFMGGNGLRHYS